MTYTVNEIDNFSYTIVLYDKTIKKYYITTATLFRIRTQSGNDNLTYFCAVLENRFLIKLELGKQNWHQHY